MLAEMTFAVKKSCRFVPIFALLALSAELGCSSNDEPGSSGAAGTQSTGGTPSGTAGTGPGGSSATGGVAGTTGAGGAAGSTSAGGATGAAGATGSGGTSTGGATGAGGATGGGGAPSAGSSGTAGSGGTAGGAGGSGNTGFAPCPTTGACKILPLGDSITVGLGYDGGYRVELFRLAHSEGHDITFTGTQSPNGPMNVDGASFPRQHAGISGQTIDQIAGRIPMPDLNGNPNIILVHAGTNDMYGNAPATAHERLGKMMDKLLKEAPDALLVFTTLVPLTFMNNAYADETMTFNSHVEGLVKERADKGAHIIFVDQFTGFMNSELGDMIHPNKAGYDRMATKFYGAIKGYLR